MAVFFKGFKVINPAALKAEIEAGTVNGFVSYKQRIPFTLKDPRGKKHKFFKKFIDKPDTPTPVLKVVKNVQEGLTASFVRTQVTQSDYVANLLELMISGSFGAQSFAQISNSINQITFPDEISIMAEDNEDGFVTGSYVIRSGSSLSPIAYAGIANSEGYVDWLFQNSSEFNTGATWSFSNTTSDPQSNFNGGELRQNDATASFTIRTYSSGSLTASYVGQISHTVARTSGTASRIDQGNFQNYVTFIPSSSGTGSNATSSTAGFNQTIISANIFGDGDERQFASLFASQSADNNFYAADRELVTFSYDTVVASGSFFFSKRFETLVGATSFGGTGYSPINQITLYWASGSNGLSGEHGLSGSITPNQALPDTTAHNILGAQSGSHLFLNSTLTAPASGGYYTTDVLLNYPATFSGDGNFTGGLPISGTVHVAGDGMRGVTTPGDQYFINPFVSAHEVSESIINAAPRWNGISFSRSPGSSFSTGDVSPGFGAYITGSNG